MARDRVRRKRHTAAFTFIRKAGRKELVIKQEYEHMSEACRPTEAGRFEFALGWPTSTAWTRPKTATDPHCISPVNLQHQELSIVLHLPQTPRPKA